MDKEKLRTTLIRGCSLLKIEINSHQVEQLLKFADLIEEANQQMNLTRITSEEDFAVKHLVDCLALQITGLDFTGRGIDVGSGAGFPGIVIASCLTRDPIILLDSLEKRVKFLQNVADELNLDHVTCIHGRAEDAARDPDYREKFQWVTARAVAPLPVLLEYCAPFIEVGGYFVAMKGSNVESELEEAANAIKLLNLSIVDQREFELPFDMGGRSIIIFKKESAISEKYPRKAGIPSKKPL